MMVQIPGGGSAGTPNHSGAVSNHGVLEGWRAYPSTLDRDPATGHDPPPLRKFRHLVFGRSHEGAACFLVCPAGDGLIATKRAAACRASLLQARDGQRAAVKEFRTCLRVGNHSESQYRIGPRPHLPILRTNVRAALRGGFSASGPISWGIEVECTRLQPVQPVRLTRTDFLERPSCRRDSPFC